MADDVTNDDLINTDYIPEICETQPLEVFMSTDLNNKIKTYDDLSERLLHFFGYPAVSVSDLHRDQLWDAITIACERFYKHAGVVKEYLIVDSRLYQRNKGIPIDKLCTLSGIMQRPTDRATHATSKRGPEQQINVPNDVYITKEYISKNDYYISQNDYDILISNVDESLKPEIDMLWAISQKYPDGIEELSIISGELYEYLIKKRNYNPENFKKSKDKVFTLGGEKLDLYEETEDLGKQRNPLEYNKMFDYDIMDYRKVASVVDYTESGVSSITSLYNFDTSLA